MNEIINKKRIQYPLYPATKEELEVIKSVRQYIPSKYVKNNSIMIYEATLLLLEFFKGNVEFTNEEIKTRFEKKSLLFDAKEEYERMHNNELSETVQDEQDRSDSGMGDMDGRECDTDRTRSEEREETTGSEGDF